MNLESIVQNKMHFTWPQIFLIKRLTAWSRKIGCLRCHKQFGMNDDVKCLLEWSNELEEMYKIMGIDAQ